RPMTPDVTHNGSQSTQSLDNQAEAVAEAAVVDTSVRIANDDDVGVLTALRHAWNEEHAGGPIDDAGFEAVFRKWWATERPSRTFFLVELDGTAVGMANIKRYDRMPVAGRPSGGWWGYIGNVFVLAEH